MSVRVLFFEEKRGLLRRVAETTVPDSSTDPTQDAWRQVGRGVQLNTGTYQVMVAGRRGKVEATTNLKATDLGPLPAGG